MMQTKNKELSFHAKTNAPTSYDWTLPRMVIGRSPSSMYTPVIFHDAS